MITHEFPKISRLSGFAAIAQNGSTMKVGADQLEAPHNGVPVSVYAIFRCQAPSPREPYDIVEILVGNGYIEPTGKKWHAHGIEEARGMVPSTHTRQFPATMNDHDTLVETWA